VGTPVATRTAPPPKVDAAQEAAFFKKVIELAPNYRTELLKEAKYLPGESACSELGVMSYCEK
jgi:hypothetical protein